MWAMSTRCCMRRKARRRFTTSRAAQTVPTPPAQAGTLAPASALPTEPRCSHHSAPVQPPAAIDRGDQSTVAPQKPEPGDDTFAARCALNETFTSACRQTDAEPTVSAAFAESAACAFAAIVESVAHASARVVAFWRHQPSVSTTADVPCPVAPGVSGVPCPAAEPACPVPADISCLVLGLQCWEQHRVPSPEDRSDALPIEQRRLLRVPRLHAPLLRLAPRPRLWNLRAWRLQLLPAVRGWQRSAVADRCEQPRYVESARLPA